MKTKTNKLIELSALIVGVSAIALVTFSLILNYYNHSINFLEPIPWIRIPEIIIGLFSIIILFKIMIKKL